MSVEVAQATAGSLLHHVPMDHCLPCASENASLRLPVAFDASDHFALPAVSPVCGVCVDLLSASEDQALAARLDTDFEDFGRADVVAHLHRRAGEPTPLPDALDSLAAFRARGFVPLHEHTGVGEELGPLWPVDDRVSTTELGLYEPEPHRMWLVRSPWGSRKLRAAQNGRPG